MVRVGLPPLAAMFNSNGTAYAAATKSPAVGRSRHVSWSGSRQRHPERYWIPAETGVNYELTPCLTPLKSVRDYVHVISGIDNVASPAQRTGPWTLTALAADDRHELHRPGRVRPSIDYMLGAKIGAKSRSTLCNRRSPESHGENVHRNMSWAGFERALPPR